MKVHPSTQASSWFKLSISIAPPKRASLPSNNEFLIFKIPFPDQEATAAIPPVLICSVGFLGVAILRKNVESSMSNPFASGALNIAAAPLEPLAPSTLTMLS